jgi:tetratricopeptide (TPR) repeat protein
LQEVELKVQAGTIAAVLLLLLLMAAEIVFSVRGESLSWDEGDHIFAGYMSLKTHDYGLNPEHPPLVKMVAALPLLPLALRVPPLQDRWYKTESYLDGRELIYRNGPSDGGRYSANTIIFRARMCVTPFVLLLALITFLAGSEMFGTAAGLVAMTLVAFEPTLLAHGPFVTTDATVSCLFLASIYCLYRWVKAPRLSRLLTVGLAGGLALAAKHSAIMLLPMMFVLLAGELIGRWVLLRRSITGAALWRRCGLHAVKLFGGLAAISALAVLILWAFYGFRYAARPAGLHLDSDMASAAHGLKPYMAQGIIILAHHRLLPESYLFGLCDVINVGNGSSTFIFGRIFAHGVWYYFPVALLIKLTLGMMGLLLMAAAAFFSGRFRPARELFFLVAPAAIYLAIAIASPLDIAIRHILPVFPFLILLAAGGACALARNSKRWLYAVAALVTFHCLSSLMAYPNYLAYANEAWGGPSQTHRYLTDANTDWGQQLIAVKAYVDQHQIHDCWFAYTVATAILPSDYGIPCKLLPTADTSWFGGDIEVPPAVHGPVFISYLDLAGYEFGSAQRNPYQQFVALEPDAVIQDGVAVYNGDYSIPMARAMKYVSDAWRLRQHKDIAGALQSAETAVSIDPEFISAQSVLGRVLQDQGRNAEATIHYKQALAIARTMEPSTQEEPVHWINERLTEISKSTAQGK